MLFADLISPQEVLQLVNIISSEPVSTDDEIMYDSSLISKCPTCKHAVHKLTKSEFNKDVIIQLNIVSTSGVQKSITCPERIHISGQYYIKTASLFRLEVPAGPDAAYSGHYISQAEMGGKVYLCDDIQISISQDGFQKTRFKHSDRYYNPFVLFYSKEPAILITPGIETSSLSNLHSVQPQTSECRDPPRSTNTRSVHPTHNPLPPSQNCAPSSASASSSVSGVSNNTSSLLVIMVQETLVLLLRLLILLFTHLQTRQLVITFLFIKNRQESCKIKYRDNPKRWKD